MCDVGVVELDILRFFWGCFKWLSYGFAFWLLKGDGFSLVFFLSCFCGDMLYFLDLST